jgi:hypothetical protein
MTGFDIDHDAIRKATVTDDNLPIGAVRLHRVNTTTAQLENEKSATWALATGFSILSSVLEPRCSPHTFVNINSAKINAVGANCWHVRAVPGMLRRLPFTDLQIQATSKLRRIAANIAKPLELLR